MARKGPTKKQVAAMEQEARNRAMRVVNISISAMCLETYSECDWIPAHLRAELGRAAAIVKRVVDELNGKHGP